MVRDWRMMSHHFQVLEPRRLLAGQISGTVFNDFNADGQQDISEPGLAGWTVFLDDNMNDRLDAGETSVTTEVDGNYTFTGAGDAVRRVAMVRPTGWRQTTQSSGRLFVERPPAAGSQYEIDPLTGALLSQRTLAIPSTSSISGTALGPDRLYFVMQRSGTGFDIHELNPDTGSALAPSTFLTTSGNFPPSGAGYLNGVLYISVPGSQSIIAWDTTTRTVLRTMNTAATIGSGLTGAAELGVLFATDSTSPFNKIHVIDPATGNVLNSLVLPVSGVTGGLAFVNGHIISPVAGNNAYRIHPNTGAVAGRFPIPGSTTLLGLAGDGSSQQVANLTTGDVSDCDFGAIAVTAAPTALDLLASSDTGGFDWDNGTTLVSGSTVFRVHGTIPGATVTLYNVVNTPNFNPWGSAVATGTTTDIVLSIPSGAFALYPFVAMQREPGKLQSERSLGLWVASGAPSPPEPLLVASSDTGYSDKDDVTSDDTPTFWGNANDGEVVRLFSNNVEVGSALVSGSTYFVTPSAPLPPGSHGMTVRIVHPPHSQFVIPVSAGNTIRVVTATPTVTGASFDYSPDKPTLNVQFSASVWGSLLAEDFVITNLDDDSTIPASAQSLFYAQATMSAALTFPGLPNGVLPDGNYRLTLSAANVADDAGNPLGADYTLDFFSLAGDANHDRVVDVADLGILASNWQETAATFAQGDFNYDGMVDVADLGILATNWQKNLAIASQPTRASWSVPSPEIAMTACRGMSATRTTNSVARLVLFPSN
jgi:hypothetical protein